jgi:hypothetical protein
MGKMVVNSSPRLCRSVEMGGWLKIKNNGSKIEDEIFTKR